MIELNKVLLAGRLTFDPELRHTGSGTAVCDLKLAVNRRGFGDREDEVLFIQVTAWGKTAEFCGKYLGRGKGVFIEGRLKMDTWEDKTDGRKREKIFVVADRIQFAEPKGAEESGGDGPTWQKKETVPAQGAEQDLPF